VSKASIRREIAELNEEIEELEKDKKLYEKMNNKIDDAVEKLTKAKESAREGYQLLGEYYQSITADKKVLEFEGEYTNISSVITTLKFDILVASNNKINEIKNSINRKQREIRNLREILASMDDD